MPAASSSPKIFRPIFGRMFDRVPVRILTFTIELHEKKAYKIREYDFGVQFDLTVIV